MFIREGIINHIRIKFSLYLIELEWDSDIFNLTQFFSCQHWRPRKVLPHPTREVSVRVDSEAYQQLTLKGPESTKVVGLRALVDTGAQMCILGLEQVHMLGLQEDNLEPANLSVNTANGGQARNLGMVFLEITANVPENGGTKIMRQQCYVLEGICHYQVQNLCFQLLYPPGAPTDEGGGCAEVAPYGSQCKAGCMP